MRRYLRYVLGCLQRRDCVYTYKGSGRGGHPTAHFFDLLHLLLKLDHNLRIELAKLLHEFANIVVLYLITSSGLNPPS